VLIGLGLAATGRTALATTVIQVTTFIVQRQAPGELRVELTIVDGCDATGSFRTFVGGGTGVQ
jgi:hypothetical protein